MNQVTRNSTSGDYAHDLTLLAHERAMVDAQIRRVVEYARRAGQTWGDIGAALGVTKQAAQQRYGVRQFTCSACRDDGCSRCS